MNVSHNCAAGISTIIIDNEQCEVYGVIRYILHQDHSAAEINPQLIIAYNTNVMTSIRNVWQP